MEWFSEPATLIPILWQCDSAVAVHKPAGLSTTSPSGTDNAESRLRDQLGRETGFLSAVHRLDRDVGGVLLVALSKKSARLLCDQFAARRVSKTYQAWVQGRIAIPAPEISPERWTDHMRKIIDIARGEICAADAPGAKLAQTDVRAIRYDDSRNRTLLELCPITGRMHQLRLQAAARGHAIVGDPLYGPQHAVHNAAFPAENIALTAIKLVFHHPRTSMLTEVSIDSPYE